MSNHPKVPSRHILDLIPPRVSVPRLSPLSLTLSLRTVRTSPPLILPSLVLRLFSTLRFQEDGAAASSCAAADYDPARERKDYNDDDNDYAWGGGGASLRSSGVGPSRRQPQALAEPVEDPPFHGESRGGGRPITPSATRGLPPGGHNRDAGVTADDKLARFAQLLRSEQNPPLTSRRSTRTGTDSSASCRSRCMATRQRMPR